MEDEADAFGVDLLARCNEEPRGARAVPREPRLAAGAGAALDAPRQRGARQGDPRADARAREMMIVQGRRFRDARLTAGTSLSPSTRPATSRMVRPSASRPGLSREKRRGAAASTTPSSVAAASSGPASAASMSSARASCELPGGTRTATVPTMPSGSTTIACSSPVFSKARSAAIALSSRARASETRPWIRVISARETSAPSRFGLVQRRLFFAEPAELGLRGGLLGLEPVPYVATHAGTFPFVGADRQRHFGRVSSMLPKSSTSSAAEP